MQPERARHARPYQLALLSRAKKVFLLMDGDEAGRKGDEQITRALKGATELHSIRLPDGKEPEHLTKAEVKQINKGNYPLEWTKINWHN